MHNQAPIQRRKSTRIYVGNVPIGDGAPIAVQSMTNTRTTDVEATVNQIKALERVGADIVRVSVPTMDAAEAFKLIKQRVNVPLVADIHFDYRIALKVAEYGVDCLRINPGNIGKKSVFAWWLTVRAIKTFRSVLALTPDRWKKICKKVWRTDAAGVAGIRHASC
ncbi:4-hydroxy-3-methylbut-2-en-1-yl diphosphate synthase [Escherichia coli]|uniref:4-hydroxy-3-methylbut-2-en-1-yl diphosphate synthase n=1 Tax=Escherichia coli TaxID=562 RepID=A0A447X1Y0_ECOLX|nr:4-hydroxy-3-methylbut-2-en-1-yl diphosphate synthase [Escherichia coli]